MQEAASAPSRAPVQPRRFSASIGFSAVSGCDINMRGRDDYYHLTRLHHLVSPLATAERLGVAVRYASDRQLECPIHPPQPRSLDAHSPLTRRSQVVA